MELQQLRYFLAVADNESLSGAATNRGVTLSTVSQAVHALERELDAVLFHRVDRGMALSSAGHALVGPARRILRGAAEAKDCVRPDPAAGGRLDIAALATTVNSPFPDLLSACLREFPDITLHLRDLPDEQQTADLLADGQSEIVCTKLPFARTPAQQVLAARLTTLEIGTYDLQVAFPPGASGIPEGTVDLAELPDLPMVLVPPANGLYPDLEEELAQGQRRMTVAAVVEQREARMAVMLAGAGATFVGDRPARAAAALGAQVRPVVPLFRQTVGLVFDHERLSPAARTFISLASSTSWRTPAGHP
jgi:DNA-binding transcriptional LysR family regulator